MLETLITSKTRIKLLVKFFLNADNSAYLTELHSEFGESSDAIRLELTRFEGADMISSGKQGNRRYYRANTHHPMFPEIHKLVMKHLELSSRKCGSHVLPAGMLQSQRCSP